MPLKFASVPHSDLGSGIDALSTEDSIPEGYSEDLSNAEPTPEGALLKRPGYQGELGSLPVRVISLAYSTASTGNLSLTLDGSIDLSLIPSAHHSRPLVIVGRTSAANTSNVGDFLQTDSAQYYPTYNADTRVSYLTGSNTLTKTAADLGLTSPLVWVGTSLSTSTTDLSNQVFLPDSVTVTHPAAGVSIGYTNNTGAPLPGFVYALPRPALLGTTYVTAPISQPAGTTTTTISAATHGLSNFLVQVKAYQDTGSAYVQLIPDSVVLHIDGSVSITLTNRTGSSFNALFILSAAPLSNIAQGSVGASSSLTVSFPVTGSFIFPTCYLELTLGGDKQECIPDSISVDASTGIASIGFTNNLPAASNFFIYWQTASVVTNKLTVDATPIGVAFSDTAPQLTIWGLDHSSIYSSSAAEEAGWVTHLDSYRSSGEEFLVSGLGGNLFKGQNRDSASAAKYLIPSYYPSLRARVSGSVNVGPAFIASTDTVTRTRGAIKGNNLDEGFGRASSITWDSGTGWTRVILPVPGLTITGTPIQTTSGLEDQLTVQGAGYSIQNGTWPIKQVTYGASSVTFLVNIPSITNGNWDDPSSAALCGVFTDQLVLDRTVPYIPGDVLLCDILTENEQVTCYAAASTTLYVGGLNRQFTFPNGIRVAGTRTSRVMPLRTVDETRSTAAIVGGDALTLSGFARQFRTLSVNPTSDQALTFAAPVAGTVTATVGSGNTYQLAIGDVVLLTQAGSYSGEQTVTDLPSSTSFSFVPLDSSNAGATGTLFGATVSLDESFSWSDTVSGSNQVYVTGRWVPFEAPDATAATSNEVPTTHVRYLDVSAYDAQPILRSTLVSDSLFLSNGVDRPLKLDGDNLYRPGLPRWQAQLFLTTCTGSSSYIDVSSITSTISLLGWTGSTFEVGVADQLTFPVGTRIKQSLDSSTVYTVTGTSTGTISGTTHYYITVDRTIVGSFSAGATASNTFTRSYYFRLNAVDVNQNVVASAVTGSFDWTFEAAGNVAARIRLVGLPVLDIYDYDRLEVQIYATKSNGVAPYYLLTTLPMGFNENRGYLDYIDSTDDALLVDLDPVNTALKGQELGVSWSQPLRAKHMTSAANRLVQANFLSDPYIDMRMIDPGTTVSASVLSGGRYLLRKDGTDTGTTTDMVNRVGYQFVTTHGTVSAVVPTVGVSFLVTTSAVHGLTVGNWVYLFRAAAQDADQQTHMMGWWQVASAPTTTTFTVAWLDTPAALTLSKECDSWAAASAPADVPVYLGQDYNWGTKEGNGIGASPQPYETIASKRLGSAINATQRLVNRSLAGQAGFRPWIVADSGGEFQTGEFVLRQTMNQPSAFSLQVPASLTGYTLFANNVLCTASQQIQAVSQVRNSRVLISYPNFPEIMDNPLAVVDSQSDSAVDVNPADGQEITACIPLFGTSAFGAALKDAVVVVFKTNSIYVINLSQKVAGQNPIQRIESQGLGCTAPYSVTVVRDGIMFANESGMYKLRTDLSVYYMGRHMQRIWREQVNLDQLDRVFGHNWSFGSTYKLSVPANGSTLPNAAYVYNSTREYSKQGITNTIQLYSTPEGSWTRHEGFSAIGWCNLGADSFYAAPVGRVFRLRRTGKVQDYRDDASPITFSATLRAMDFGDDGVRKTVPYAVVTYRNPVEEGLRLGTLVTYSLDLSANWRTADATALPDRTEDTGTGDLYGNKALSLRYSFGEKKGVRFQLAITNSSIDQPLEITKVRYFVAGITTPKGVQQAAAGAVNPG